jgi:hypothetical protein
VVPAVVVVMGALGVQATSIPPAKSRVRSFVNFIFAVSFLSEKDAMVSS